MTISSIRIDRNVPVETRDHVILRCDIYRPDDKARHPAILMRTPYNKNIEDSDFLDKVNAAFSGYAVVLQDTRGRFTSDGEYHLSYLRNLEGLDGYDSVEWIASQPWCDGNVGMCGLSYLALTQWTAAVENPPHLRAIVPSMIGSAGWPLDEQVRVSGGMLLHMLGCWVASMGINMADRLEQQGKDVSQMRQMLAQVLLNPDVVYNYLPCEDVPQFQFEGVRELWHDVRLNLTSSPGFREKPYWAYDRVNVPCFHIGGWYDIYNWAIFRNFLNMRQSGGSPRARNCQHVLVGPWCHGRRLQGFTGDLNFGTVAGVPAALITEQHLAYFNKYLQGMDIELPVVRYFTMGRNIWQNADTWPLPQTRWLRFYLHSKGKANTSSGDGLLSPDEPGSEHPDTFTYDPFHPVPTVGGCVFPAPGLIGGPVDQSYIEKRSDVLCYTTSEIEDDFEITGPLKFHLFAATSAKDTDFTARLVDVHPNGQSYPVANGIIRARYRKSLSKAEPVSPGAVYEYTIDMGNTSQLFRIGHRARIDISSSDFPGFDRNMNTGGPIGEDIHGIVAIQNIYHRGSYASYIDLPVIPAGK